MSDLAQRLRDVDEAGIFRLNCEMQKLHAIAAEAGMVLLEADLSAVGSKGEFLAAVAQAVKAPEWFGNNWDALADALGDLSWLDMAVEPVPGYVLLLHNGGEMLGLSPEEHAIALEIFGDAVKFWKSQDKPFWVFFC
jgi:Barstar (barnase inhibitor)